MGFQMNNSPENINNNEMFNQKENGIVKNIRFCPISVSACPLLCAHNP